MLTKLYQLHMAYQKHTGVPTGCASPRPDGGQLWRPVLLRGL